ncbi:hypothetical protein F7725_021886 [Dissostichus mawsoni]|uniref:Uncharacterized protein n=1 Tax=Dissostichus mawsoni TaxID=36200 RepID=A0A7J5ZFS4_DISMA|nr:hypothetical protein F7725_021886 [Dissostichus mawsoni]
MEGGRGGETEREKTRVGNRQKEHQIRCGLSLLFLIATSSLPQTEEEQRGMVFIVKVLFTLIWHIMLMLLSAYMRVQARS